MQTFDDNIQLEKGIDIPFIKNPPNLIQFYKDDSKVVSLYGSNTLKDILDLVAYSFAEEDRIPACKLYLPVNKKTLGVSEILSFIKEQTIDLTTSKGRQETRRRLGILAYLLSKQPKGYTQDMVLDTGGAGTHIGYFKFPDGSLRHVVTFWRSDKGENGYWGFNVIDNKRFHADPSFWFAFSSELEDLVNSSSIMT